MSEHMQVSFLATGIDGLVYMGRKGIRGTDAEDIKRGKEHDSSGVFSYRDAEIKTCPTHDIEYDTETGCPWCYNEYRKDRMNLRDDE